MIKWFKFFRSKNEDPESTDRIKALERVINTKIDDPAFFLKALRHRSTLLRDDYEKHDSYERLEFLGDSVLDLIASEILFVRYPKETEGFLTKTRAKMVKGETLSRLAREMGLNELMEMGERSASAKVSKSILADAFEAIVAAIYITKGYREAYRFVEMVYDRYIDFDDFVQNDDNFKSLLLEYAQGKKLDLPKYQTVDEYGPGHSRTFEVEVYIGDERMGQGKGKSKKKAEQEAARVAIQSLGI
jgi:ribonuclease-3